MKRREMNTKAEKEVIHDEADATAREVLREKMAAMQLVNDAAAEALRVKTLPEARQTFWDRLRKLIGA